MRKIFIWALAAVSFIAITALVLIQLIWIRDAFKVQDQQFDLIVNKSLSQIISRLENIETVATFNQLRDELAKAGDTVNVGKLNLPDHLAIENNSSGSEITDENRDYYYLEGRSSFNIETTIDLISGDTLVFLRENSLYQSDRIENQPRSMISKGDFEANYQKLIADKKIYVEKVLNQIVRKEGLIEERLTFPALDSAIRDEFMDKGISIPYEFAVRTGNRYTLVTKGFSPYSDHEKYRTLLFPHDVRTAPNFLVVYFPTQRNYILRSVGIMAGSSLLIVLIILIISFVAIWIIFRQKKLSEIKNDFINNMTHELKTPISTISLASQMLADKNLSPEAKNNNYISALIQEESKRLGNQVEKVLQVSIFEEGSMKLKYSSINMDDLVRRAVDKIAIQVEQRNGNIELKLGYTNNLLEGDEVHLANVIFNLIDNAIKYCKVEPRIVIETGVTKTGITLAVSDNGIGISKEHQKRIFDKFYRVPTGNVHDVKGFGIGLSYVRKVVEQHHGRIEVESEKGKGTTFRIYLPKTQKEK